MNDKKLSRLKSIMIGKIPLFVVVIISFLVIAVTAIILLYNPSETVEVLAEAQVTGTQVTSQNQATETEVNQTHVAETSKNQVLTQPSQLSKSELVKYNSVNITLKDGSIIKSGDLIENLDKNTDDTIKYVYNESPKDIKIGNIYEGSFSYNSKKELLVIFKFLNLSHVAGLDFSVAAIFDKDTLRLVSQKSFASDECQFDVVKDTKGLTYLIFSGTTTYQGHSTCMLQLIRLSNNWEQLLPLEDGIFSNGKYKFQLISNGLVSVLEPEFKENDVVGWKKKYYLKWNEVTAKLDNFTPYKLTYSKAKKYFDVDSTSPNGRYAVVSHEWGFDESSYVLVYDITKNKLLNKFDLLAQDFGYVWSPDSKKLCVTKLARIWIDTSIIDIQTKKVVTMTEKGLVGFSEFQALGVKFDYKLRENRPDPYYQVCEWSPDSKRVLMFYQWTDSNDQRQSGNFIYNLDKQTTTNITQNKPDIGDGEHLEPKKPKGFKW